MTGRPQRDAAARFYLKDTNSVRDWVETGVNDQCVDADIVQLADLLWSREAVLTQALRDLLTHDIAGGPCDGTSSGCQCYTNAERAIAGQTK